MTDWSTRGFETRAIHAGNEPDPATGALVAPIYANSTFRQARVGQPEAGYEYSRCANPSRTALSETIAALEQGSQGFCYPSGLAAQDALVRAVCRPGDHVLVPDDVYGGTFRLLEQVFTAWGVQMSVVAMSDPATVREAITDRTRLIWLETPSNPLLAIANIEAICELAHAPRSTGPKILVAVDNTFASPYLQQPLLLGADIVVHSTTKYLAGHSDLIGGALVMAKAAASEPATSSNQAANSQAGNSQAGAAGEPSSPRSIAEELEFAQNATGSVASPFDCWLTTRGIKTLAVRMDRHCDNAEKVAEFLTRHRAVQKVYYPGLPSHPGYSSAVRQMQRFGGIVSFEVHGGEPAARAVCEATEVFALAESLGGVESLIEMPGVMTHASVSGTRLAPPAALIRLSVGLESGTDLLADLEQALERDVS